jgi:release factor H-coupled RctB family protein
MENKSKVEIKIVCTDKSWIESNSIDQLKQVAGFRGMVRAVGLPDLHTGKTPVGAAFVTEGIIYPHIVGNDIGCGMALFKTDLKKNKFKLDKIVEKLEKIDGIDNINIDDDLSKVDYPFKDKLGTIGSGNHFAELQAVDKVYDEAAAEEVALSKSSIYLLVHSGSRSYGEFILRKYIEEHSCQNGLQEGSEAFHQYFKDYESAVSYASLNRELIAYRIMTALGSGVVKLLDSVHNGISIVDSGGKLQYIHRKGAAPSDIGCVVVAGSRGTNSYIVKPEENLWEYAFSVSHGAGRKWSRFGCKEKLENIYSKKAVRQSKLASTLVYKDKNVLYEEAPEAYKNIDRVIEDMLEKKMIKVVAEMKPLVTYKV